MVLRDDAPKRRAHRRSVYGFPQGLAVKLQVSLDIMAVSRKRSTCPDLSCQ